MKSVKYLLLLMLPVMIIVIPISLIVSPDLLAMLVRALFYGGASKKRESYSESLSKVDLYQNLRYNSRFKGNTMDLIIPKDKDVSLPVILWIHGGAFVGGDKSDILEYGVEIAAQGYVVANMNYQRAPQSKYPNQIRQIEEAIAFLNENVSHYCLDMEQIILAGDSAGAHMAAQFAMIQSDPRYADRVQIKPTVNKNSLRAALLFCGPYDFSYAESMKGIFGAILKKMIWAYTGYRDWYICEDIEPLSLLNYVNSSFPATFITDGNRHTFTQSGLDFASKLKIEGVDVDAIFYDIEEEVLPHVYQFDMTLKSSVQTFDSMIDFMKRRVD